jgi:valyl-tRNA synthetase
MGVPAGALMPLLLVQASPSLARIVEAWGETIKRMARIDRIEFAHAPLPGFLPIVVRQTLVGIGVAGFVDLDAERARLDKEVARERQEIAKVDAKLANPDFAARAPEDVIAEHHERREASLSRIAKLEAARARIDRI